MTYMFLQCKIQQKRHLYSFQKIICVFINLFIVSYVCISHPIIAFECKILKDKKYDSKSSEIIFSTIAYDKSTLRRQEKLGLHNFCRPTLRGSVAKTQVTQ